jgi:molybdopterin synthase sulfur carrier subunit
MRREKSFRGISKRLAVHYLTNLGGELVAGDPEDDAEARVADDDWTATLSVGEASIGPSVTLTEVHVAFEGDDDVLDPLVEQFAQKAMRAGG